MMCPKWGLLVGHTGRCLSRTPAVLPEEHPTQPPTLHILPYLPSHFLIVMSVYADSTP